MIALLFLPAVLAQDAPPIVNGSPESGFPSTVALGADFGGNVFSACTGNMITPKIVLTAGHCSGDIPLEWVVKLGQAFFGESVYAPDDTRGFTDLFVHPDYELQSDINGTIGINDIALLVLDDDAPVAPTRFNVNPVTDEDIGIEMVSVGFGITSGSGSDSGEKRSAEIVLDEYDELFLLSYNNTNPDSGNICSGDSGGPQFYEQDGQWVQWAIHAYGDTNCSYFSGSTRTDIFADWIFEQIQEVHGTTDLCEINDWYDDGVCDSDCEQTDGDCVDDSEDTGEEADDPEEERGGCACSVTPVSPWGPGLIALMLAAVSTRRRRL